MSTIWLDAQIEGFDNKVKLSYESRIAVFEGDEYLTSPIDLRPKISFIQTAHCSSDRIAWDHINVFPLSKSTWSNSQNYRIDGSSGTIDLF